MTYIKISNLEKEIKGAKLLNDISLDLESGNIYGLIGDNGSGKTMLMRAMSGLVVPNKGEVYYENQQLGKDFEFPDSLGLLIETPGFLLDYTHFTNLKLLASIKGEISDEAIRQALEKVGLDSKLKLKVRHFSLGMKQRLGIAQAIMENPEVLILDEPFNGLDTKGVDEIRELLLALKKDGKLIVISSHQQDNIDYLCDEVFEIAQGKLKRRIG